ELALLVFLLVTETSNWSWLPFLFFAPFGIYLAALRMVDRQDHEDSEKISLIIVFAIIFRLTLLFSGPVFSFDVYRYYWDGKVAANGINPYLYPADAPELASLRDANWELVNHKYLRSGYPPLMELFLELLYLSFHSVQIYKVSFFLFDIGTILTILLIVRQLGINDKYLIVYAWAPLSIIEISQTGHNDSMMVFLMIASFLLLLRGRRNLSSLVMGLSAASKLLPIFFAPVLFRRWGKTGTLIFFLVVAALQLPFADIGLKMYYGLLYVVNTTFFNGSVFPAVTGMLKWMDLSANPGFAAQLVVYSIYAIVLLWGLLLSFRRQADSIELMKVCFLLAGTVLLLNRTFFPWYVAWILPFIVFYRSRSWLLLSGTIFLSYMKYNALPPPPYEGVDATTAIVIDLLQYLPFYVLFAYELFTKRIILRGSRGP
ncbi:glycosyltransferase 87 family protein, partial [[Eubacterium] cellulosolvens]